ncbi:L-lactate dehydrogenase [Anaeromicrobium sediminis]|uniref:L-lactate dehydrogenase n=1 Tax=Anaeromicrobium sediminis TaxID=1478221 RepID=A0A267M8H1_9FIRM|nr:L-lactate dehydrogenase [Anaeromicrobium sediminis]PAB55747.1 L-lactate dehydrogenase [Anaeromicrobium sediminis]
MIKTNKIVIIGLGFVGSATAFTLMHSSLISEMVLIDINKEKAQGEAMDLNHGMSFVKSMDIKAGDYSDCENADIIIISAGPSIGPNETRLDLANKNSIIIKKIVDEIQKYTKSSIILVATNPVDILTYIVSKECGYNPKKVIGSGTVLDSSRFRYLLSKHCNIDTRNVHGYILGEHGDSEVAAWSLTNIAGTRIHEYCPMCNLTCTKDEREKIFHEVKNSAYEVLEKKGATSYGIALSIRRIVEAILRDENSVLTVSSLLDSQYGINDIALSVPTLIGRNGVHKVLDLPLEEEELTQLHKSANKLKETVNSIK